MVSHLTAVLIHGLPEPDLPLFARLDPVEAEVRQVIPSVLRLSWLEAVSQPMLKLARGQFARTLVPWLQTELHAATADGARLVVVAYSAGGLLLYRWLIDPETPDALREQIAGAIVLAGPYQCREKEVLLEYDDRPVKVGERDLTEAEIEGIAASLPGRLTVLLGDRDRTIKPWNALLPPELCEQYGVGQETVSGATHLGVCADARVLERVRSSLVLLQSPSQ